MTLSLWNSWWSSGISLFFLSFFSSIFYKFLSSCQDILLSLTELVCWCGVALSAMIARRLLQMERPSLTFINGMFLLYFTIDAVMGALETYFSFRLFRERWWQYYLDILIFSCTFFPLNNAGDFKRLRGKKPRHTQCTMQYQFPIFTLSKYLSSFLCAVRSVALRRLMSTTAWCSALSGRFGTPTGCSSTWPFSSPGNYSLIFSIKLVTSLV